MIVRPARQADADAMGWVTVTSFLAAHRDHMPEKAWQGRKRYWLPEDSAASWSRFMRANKKSNCVYVAEKDGIVGVGMGRKMGSVGEIGALYVLPDCHRRGIGRALFDAVFTHMNRWHVESIQVGVLELNSPAQAFYEATGGHLAGERPFDENGTMLTEVVYSWPIDRR